MFILGISGQERDAAAALVRDGQVIAAIEEEEFSRIRHVGMSYTGGLPYRSMEFCLERAGVPLEQVDYVAYYLEPHKLFHREIAFRSARATRSTDPWQDGDFPPYFVDCLNGLRERMRTKLLVESSLPGNGRFITVNHQLAHAASAFYPSGFDHAAVITVGNKGDMTTTGLLTGKGERLDLQAEAFYPNSIGMVYGALAAALGYGEAGDCHKPMWLSVTGAPVFVDIFRDAISVDAQGLPSISPDYFEFSARGEPALSKHFFERLGLGPRQKDEPVTAMHRNVAASLQQRVEDVLCEIAARHRERTGEENLCLAGGVALNSLANAAIERRAGYKRIFVQPAAGNAGCSIGAALYVWHQVLGHSARDYEMRDVFLGPEFTDEAIKNVLDNCKLNYQYYLTEDKLASGLAQFLAQGMIVGWFRGAMEFGPRALGARSILASPANEMMRANLNTYIKHREEFRPFSAAVPEERAAEFFEPSGLTGFIQAVSRIKEGKRALVPAAVFGDGLVRVHTVSRKINPPFWKLLVKFGEATGVPVLLNTSFNLFGEPVVANPREAVRGFYCSGIDCLAIGNFVIRK